MNHTSHSVPPSAESSPSYDPNGAPPESLREKRDAEVQQHMGLFDTYGAPLSCRVFTQVGVILNHLHVRQERWRARMPTDDLDLLGELQRMAVPQRAGRLNPHAELLLLFALALDISDDARRLLRTVSPRYPYPCIRAIANLTGLTGDALDVLTRELEDNAPLVHFGLVDVNGPMELSGLAARWLGGPVNLRRASVYITAQGVNFLLGLPLESGLEHEEENTVPWWAFWRS